MQPECPSTFDAGKYLVARERMQRRRQLWHAARLACPDHASFLANMHVIEKAVSARLIDEFGG